MTYWLDEGVHQLSPIRREQGKEIRIIFGTNRTIRVTIYGPDGESINWLDWADEEGAQATEYVRSLMEHEVLDRLARRRKADIQ